MQLGGESALGGRAEVEQELQRWIEQWQEHGFGAWTVFARTTEERLGRVEFKPGGPGRSGVASDDEKVSVLPASRLTRRGSAGPSFPPRRLRLAL
jgi:hypothetical protein